LVLRVFAIIHLLWVAFTSFTSRWLSPSFRTFKGQADLRASFPITVLHVFTVNLRCVAALAGSLMVLRSSD
jgi:hypothetical protein